MEIHYLCVKYFLKNEKLLMALKSILILSKEKNSYYYIESVKLINKYLQDNKDKLKGKEIIINKINEIIKDGEEKNVYKVDNKLDEVKFKLYEKGLFDNPKENNEIIFEYVNSYNTKELRKLKGEKIYELITFSSLYINEEGVKEIKNKLYEQMKLLDMDEKEILRNLNFYEDKKFN